MTNGPGDPPGSWVACVGMSGLGRVAGRLSRLYTLYPGEGSRVTRTYSQREYTVSVEAPGADAPRTPELSGAPPRRPPLSCRFGLQHVRRRRCLPRGQWMLRAGTAAQSAAGVREDETLTSSIEPSGESLAARTTRPLLAGSLDAAHTAVTFAHTITTVHTTHALPPARPRRGSRLQFWRLAGRRTLAGDGGASGDGSADGRASREAALLSALAQRHSAKPSSGAVSAVMLELQVGAPPPHLPFALILPPLSLSPGIPLLPSSFVCFHPPLTVAHGDSHASGGGCGRCPLPYPHSRAPRPTPRSPRRPSRGAPALPRRDPGTSG